MHTKRGLRGTTYKAGVSIQASGSCIRLQPLDRESHTTDPIIACSQDVPCKGSCMLDKLTRRACEAGVSRHAGGSYVDVRL